MPLFAGADLGQPHFLPDGFLENVTFCAAKRGVFIRVCYLGPFKPHRIVKSCCDFQRESSGIDGFLGGL